MFVPQYRFKIAVNDTEQDDYAVEYLPNGSALTAISLSGIINLSVGDRVWLVSANTGDTSTLLVKHANVNLAKIGI